MRAASESRALYQPQTPLIETSPGFKAASSVKSNSADWCCCATPPPARDGLRADALSARGDLAEGVLRLSGGAVRFERHGLEDTVTAR
jgi:hypothetical protein